MSKRTRNTIRRAVMRAAMPANTVLDFARSAIIDRTDTDTLTRSVHVRASTVDEESRTVEATLATESPVQVFDARRWEVIDEVLLISGARFAGSVPMLDSHNRGRVSDVIGSVREITRNPNETPATLSGRLHFAETDGGNVAFALVRGGHLSDVSVGYRVAKWVDIEAGKTRRIKGIEYTAAADRPLRVVTDWTVREASPTGIGADPAAKMRGDDSRGADRGRVNARGLIVMKMSAQLRGYLETLGLRSDASDAEAWTYFDGLEVGSSERIAAEAIRAQYDGQRSAPPAGGQGGQIPGTGDQGRQTPPANGDQGRQNPPAAGGDIDADAMRAEGARLERERCQQIRDAGRGLVADDVVERAISEGLAIDAARAQFLEAVRGSRDESRGADGPHAHLSGRRSAQVTAAALAMGLAIRCGIAPERIARVSTRGGHVRFGRLGNTDESRREIDRLFEQGERFQYLSALEICREALRVAGRAEAGAGYSPEEVVRAAVSTGEVSGLFTTNAAARLLEAYEAGGDSTRGWTRETDVADFKTNERHRLEAGAALQKLPRGGTAEHGERSSALESYKIARFARQWVMDEQDIIDNNLSPLLDMPEEFGAAALQLRPDLVFSILLANANMRDGVALFHAATHGNLQTGSALAAATLGAGKTLMNTQTENGRPLGIFAKVLLVPEALDWTARQLVSSAEIRDGGASAQYGTMNPAAGQFAVVADSRLDNGVTDPVSGTVHAGSATTWFLAANSGRHTIEVGYRAGTGRLPVVRSYPLSGGQWGIGFDVNMDIGAKALGWEGLVKSTA